MKKRLFAAVLSIMLVVSLTACGSDAPKAEAPAPDEAATAAPAEVATEAPAEVPAAVELESAGTLGKYDVQIHDFELCEDYSGAPAILISFSFTNNSEENAMPVVVLSAVAYQNGVQLDNAIVMDDSLYNANDSMKEIQPGASIDLKTPFVLTSDTAPVEFEVSESFSFSGDRLGKTFEISEGGITTLSTAPAGEKVEVIGDYSLSVISHEFAEDYDGKKALIVNFGFTNNGEKTTNFITALDPNAFQDGVELEIAILTEGDVGGSQLRNVKPGAGIPVSVAYLLTSDTSPAEIEVSEMFAFSNDAMKATIDIA